MLQFFLDLRLLTVNDAIPGSPTTRLHIRSECEKASSGAVSQIHLLFPSPLSLSLLCATTTRTRPMTGVSQGLTERVEMGCSGEAKRGEGREGAITLIPKVPTSALSRAPRGVKCHESVTAPTLSARYTPRCVHRRPVAEEKRAPTPWYQRRGRWWLWIRTFRVYGGCEELIIGERKRRS